MPLLKRRLTARQLIPLQRVITARQAETLDASRSPELLRMREEKTKLPVTSQMDHNVEQTQADQSQSPALRQDIARLLWCRLQSVVVLVEYQQSDAGCAMHAAHTVRTTDGGHVE